MAVFSVIKLSELEGAKRLDAEYYKTVFSSLKTLDKFDVKQLNAISDIAYGTTPPGGVFEETGIPFVRSQNFTMGMVNKAEIVFCKKDFHEQNKKSAIRPGDILFAAVGGTIGQIAIVQDSIKEGNINQNIARVRILDSNIKPHYAGLFFLSKYGQLQIFRFVTGNAQAYLNSFQIGSLKIPLLSEKIQNELSLCFKKVEKFIENSYSLYSQAETLLLKELGLENFKPTYKKTYTAKLSDVISARRMDAEYFQPAYEEVIEKLKERNIKLKPLGKLILGMQKGIEVGSEKYQDEGKLFIRVSNVSINGFVDRDQKYISEELYKDLKETYEPKLGDFLLTKDATPGIAYVVKEQIEGIISSGILKLQINENEINKEYLALCINSLVGKMQVERDGGGSVILHWKPDQVKRLQIPILPLPIQQNIASLVQKSYEARKKAKELLEIAKKAVEIAIEKNEKEALDYILKVKT
ncbi:restriction endonuclease subunit S [Caldisericum sp.]|uniref:restriction endonuclease subunit S n=1 Tax=Caldisericum sp. TaxID=2499687 RepID=UPI003D123B19